MSSMKYATPLNLELSPSRHLAAGLVLAHAAAMAALFLPMTVPIGLRILLAIAVIWHLRCTLPRHAWLSDSSSVVRLVWGEDGLWTVVNRDGHSDTAALLGDTYVSLHLIVLRLTREEGGRQAVVLMGDMLDADTLRRLRVRLKLDGTGEREE